MKQKRRIAAPYLKDKHLNVFDCANKCGKYGKRVISWEGHIAGFFSGILLSLFYRNNGPKQKKYQWEIDEELEDIK